MAKEKDPEFIRWALEKVCDSNGITTKEIHRSDERKQYWPDKAKSNVNSALYQLKGEEKIYQADPAEGSSAPMWFCSNEDTDGGEGVPNPPNQGTDPLGSIL